MRLVILENVKAQIFDAGGTAVGSEFLVNSATIGGQSYPSVAALTSGGSFDLRGISGSLDFDVATGEAPGPIEVWRVNSAYTEFEAQSTVEP